MLNERYFRSYLSVPALSEKHLEKARHLDAGTIVLDLEDSVALADKGEARNRVINYLSGHSIVAGGSRIAIRINDPRAKEGLEDLIVLYRADLASKVTIIIPKVEEPADIHFVERFLAKLDGGANHAVGPTLEPVIETARGVQNVNAVAECSRNIAALHFGAGDFAASIGARVSCIGGQTPAYCVGPEKVPQDIWHYALMRVVIAARANGLAAIDGAYGNIVDLAGYRSAASAAHSLGCSGKWVLHPSQLQALNEVCRPTPEEIRKAHAVLAALTSTGVASVEGEMVDAVSIKMAKSILAETEIKKSEL